MASLHQASHVEQAAVAEVAELGLVDGAAAVPVVAAEDALVALVLAEAGVVDSPRSPESAGATAERKLVASLS